MEENKAAGNSYISRTSGLKGKDYFGYALVDLGGCLVFSLVTTLLQKFYTDIFALSPLFIMIMFVAARIWDAVNDPIMCRIPDIRKPGKRGRYRPWILYPALPLTLSAVLMLVRWPGLGAETVTATCVYAAVTYVLFGMCYTVLQIPYGSLASVVTTDEKERSKLSIFRSAGAAIGSIPVLLIASFAYEKRVDAAGNAILGENGRPLQDMVYKPVLLGVIAMAVLSLIVLIVSFTMNKERVVSEKPKENRAKGREVIRLLFKNKAFVAVSVAGMLLLAGQMFTQSFYTYLFDDYFGANWMNLASQACTYAPMLIAMFLTPKLARKFGKKELCAGGILLAAVANLALFFLKGVDPGKLIVPFLLLCFISGFGLVFIVLQIWALATDAIDDIQVRTGIRDEGTAYSFFMFFRKMGQAISAVIVNGSLLAMNYKYEKGAVQTMGNLKIMYNLATLIPAILFGLMALVLIFWYPLTKEKVGELQAEKEEMLRRDHENNHIRI